MKRITYLILAHNDPGHLNRLINRLDTGRADFVIHVDAKSDLAPFTAIAQKPSVHLVNERVGVNWGAWTMIEATGRLIRKALDIGRAEESSHFVLLSGADYPLVGSETIEAHFTSQPDHQFIRWIDIRKSGQHYLDAIERTFFFEQFPLWHPGFRGTANKALRKIFGAMASIKKKELDPRTTYAFGSQWWALTPPCAEQAVQEIENKGPLASFLKSARAPDELFFHTFVANSEFAPGADGEQPYEGRGTYRLANFHIIDPSLSRWYTNSDFDEIKGSEKLFIRKVSTQKSSELLDRLDQRVRATRA